MLVDKSKGTYHNQDAQNVRRVPNGVVAGFGGLHDVCDILDDLFLEGGRNIRVSFVANSFLGRYQIAGSLDELSGQRRIGGRGAIGQLVGVLDEALGKDPMSKCSGNQVKDSQRSLFSVHGDFWLEHRDCVGFDDFQNGFGGQGSGQPAPQDPNTAKGFGFGSVVVLVRGSDSSIGRSVGCCCWKSRQDDERSGNPSPEGPDEQMYNELFASGEVFLVDETIRFCQRCPLTAGE